jgi:Lrp/AsnC family transcriptional regulator, leucine-responsive regulatory protein
MESPVVDGLDHAIIGELRSNARLSWRELGERVGLGPTATADRVRRLEQIGVLRGYHADVDLSALGMGLRAITELRLTPDTPYADFEATLRATPEVQLAFHVTGSLDYVLMLACPDVATLDRLLSRWRIEGGALESSTRILLRDVDLYS